jgi:type I restriction enzyme S subunit
MAIRTIAEICLATDNSRTTPTWTESGIVVVRSKNIKNGRLDLTAQPSYTDEESFANRTKNVIPRAGDVIITREAPMGEVCMIPPDLRCCMGQRMVLLRPNPELILPEYLLYSLLAPQAKRQIGIHEGSGSTVSNLRVPMILGLKIDVPSLADQQRAVAVLGAIDAKMDLNRKLNERLVEWARALFVSWFVDFDPVRAKIENQHAFYKDTATDALFPDGFSSSELGQVPAGWSVEPLDSVAKFLNGIALQRCPPVPGRPTLPVIKIAQLRAGRPSPDDQADASVPDQYVIHDGDLIFSWSGSLLVDIWCGGPGALNQHLFKVTSERYPTWFVKAWLDHHLPKFQAIAADKATTMGHIQRHHLAEAKIVVATPAVIAASGRILGPALERVIAARLESRALAHMRDALLHGLLSGDARAAGIAPPQEA